MSAIDPSLLFYAGQQQQQQAVNGTSNAGHQGRGDGDAVMKQEESGADWQRQREANGADASNGLAASGSRADLQGGSSSSAAGPSAAGEAQTHTDSKEDATLAAFLAKMDDYEPILPDNVTRYYLERAGFQSNDDRV